MSLDENAVAGQTEQHTAASQTGFLNNNNS